MAEYIDTANLFSSGSHVWRWTDQEQRAKEFGTSGVDGAGSMVIHNGPRNGRIEGLLKASASSRAAADTAMNALVAAVEAVRRKVLPVVWKDDVGQSGDNLRITRFSPTGPRQYSQGGAVVECWLFYVCEVREQDGKGGP